LDSDKITFGKYSKNINILERSMVPLQKIEQNKIKNIEFSYDKLKTRYKIVTKSQDNIDKFKTSNDLMRNKILYKQYDNNINVFTNDEISKNTNVAYQNYILFKDKNPSIIYKNSIKKKSVSSLSFFS
jgi:hypothetical protein